MSFVPEFMQSYVDSARKVQENWIKSFESVTENAGKRVKMPSRSEFDAERAEKNVDEFFDRWIKAIETQRAMTKKVVGFQVGTAKSAADQVEKLGEKGREQASHLLSTAKGEDGGVQSRLAEQMNSVTETMNEQLKAATDALSRFAGKAEDSAKEASDDFSTAAQEAADDAEKDAADAADAAEEKIEG